MSTESYFQDAAIEWKGSTVRFAAEEGRAVEGGALYWHGGGDPSSWLAVQVFLMARKKLEEAPDAVALELAAQALGTPLDRLVSAIRWHEEYMRWHDGDPEYRVLDA